MNIEATPAGKVIQQEILDLNDKMERKITEGIIRHMTSDEYRGRWALVSVDRRNAVITVEWKYNSLDLASQCDVMAYSRNIEFNPSVENAAHQYVGRFKGDGHFEVELAEGCSYFFELRFTNMSLFEQEFRKRQKSKTEAVDATAINHVYFIVAVPLSAKARDLLKKAGKLENNAGEQILHVAQNLIDKENAFDEARARIIEEIKKKGLSPEEEEQRIERMVDMINQERERFGL